jgi:hypothetical protein
VQVSGFCRHPNLLFRVYKNPQIRSVFTTGLQHITQMAPTLRNSSAQNSPTRTNIIHSPTTTPRKTPQCSKCQRPRAGHPRSGCPFVDSPLCETETQDKPDNHLTDALGSMSLLSPVPIESKEDKAFIRNRHRVSTQPEIVPSDSLLSLSTNSSEIVARLLQPGMFDDIDEDDNCGGKGKISKIVRWQETIATSSAFPNTPSKPKVPARFPMPGSLFPPTPESSFASTRPSDVEGISVIIRRSNIAFANPPDADDASVCSTSTVDQPGPPLARSMSASQREMFISELEPEAKATLCIFDKTDIAAIYAKAVTHHKFVFQVMNNDKNDSQAFLVVGEDEEAVHALLRQVGTENERAKAKLEDSVQPKSRSSKLGMAAGGVVVGAVGAWAGLAFS